MVLEKRYCVEYSSGRGECYDEDGFWYSEKGRIVKWVILGSFFFFFLAWFLGGYIHAKRRLKKGLPLLSYHRFLISYSERRRHGQVPENHFTFYQGHPYYPQQQQQQPYEQRPGGPYAEPPPLYNNNDTPPQYYAPPGATKTNSNQRHDEQMEMPQYGAPQYGAPQYGAPQYGAPQTSFGAPQGAQQSGVVGSSASGDVEQGQAHALPPRPQQAKAALRGFVDRFRR